jgi:2-polyprenyl-6-hydroxyphenyl methylase/3-demethylubiquinone-9 3-methyltransferase
MNIKWKIAQATEIRWWQRYLGNKSVPDYLAWKKAYWVDFLAKIGIALSPSEYVLDAGCGPAGIFMVTEAQKTVALDPLLEEYAAKIPHFQPKSYPNTTFVASPLEKYNAPKQFDTVFCLNAINHVADLGASFDKIVDLTKANGRLVVSIDAHNYGFFKHLFRTLPGDILHPHQYDLAEYEAMLTRRGCHIARTVLMKKEFFFNYYVLVTTKSL